MLKILISVLVFIGLGQNTLLACSPPLFPLTSAVKTTKKQLEFQQDKTRHQNLFFTLNPCPGDDGKRSVSISEKEKKKIQEEMRAIEAKWQKAE